MLGAGGVELDVTRAVAASHPRSASKSMKAATMETTTMETTGMKASAVKTATAMEAAATTTVETTAAMTTATSRIGHAPERCCRNRSHKDRANRQ